MIIFQYIFSVKKENIGCSVSFNKVTMLLKCLIKYKELKNYVELIEEKNQKTQNEQGDWRAHKRIHKIF